MLGPRGCRSAWIACVAACAIASVCAHAREARAAGALTATAAAAVHDLGPVGASAVVVAAPLASDIPAPRGEELAVRVATLVAGQLGGAAHAHPQTASLAVARAVAAKGGALVYVQVTVAGGLVRVVADLYPVMSNAWDRIRAPAPSPRAHAFESAPIDAEVRAFLTPILLEQAHVHKAKHDLGEVLAVACGDLDGDGGMELALVSRKTVAWGHLRGGRFVPVREAAWTALAPRAPVPWRDPLGTAAIASPRGEPGGVDATGLGSSLYAGTTDRGGVVLSRDLRGAAPLAGLPFVAPAGVACARPDPAVLAFDVPVTPCTGSSQPFSLEAPAARYDAFVGFDLIHPDGSSHVTTAARDPDGTLHVRQDVGAKVADHGGPPPPDEITSLHAGAQVALGDLDQDGFPEVVTTTDAGDDAILVWSFRNGELRPRLRLPAPAGVRSLAICPAEERGVPALIAVVGSEVWVVR